MNDQYDASKNTPVEAPKPLNNKTNKYDALLHDYKILLKEYNRLLVEVNTLRKKSQTSKMEYRELNREFNSFKSQINKRLIYLESEIRDLNENKIDKK